MEIFAAASMLVGLVALYTSARAIRRAQISWVAPRLVRTGSRSALALGWAAAWGSPPGRETARVATTLEAAHVAGGRVALLSGHIAALSGVLLAGACAVVATQAQGIVAGGTLAGLALLCTLTVRSPRPLSGPVSSALAWTLLIAGCGSIAFGGSLLDLQVDKVALPMGARLWLLTLAGGALALRQGGWSMGIAGAIGLTAGGTIEATSGAALAVGAQVGAGWRMLPLVRLEREDHARHALVGVLLHTATTLAGLIVLIASLPWMQATSSFVGVATAVALAWTLGLGALAALMPIVSEVVEQAFAPSPRIGGAALTEPAPALVGCEARLEEARKGIRSLARLVLKEETPTELRQRNLVQRIDLQLAEVQEICEAIVGDGTSDERIQLRACARRARNMSELIDELLRTRVVDLQPRQRMEAQVAGRIRSLRLATLDLLGGYEPEALEGARQAHEQHAADLAHHLNSAVQLGSMRPEEAQALGRSLHDLREVAARAQALAA